MTIRNLHQRKITAARLDEFREKLEALEAAPPTEANAAIAHRLAIAQTRSYIEDFAAELAAFDELAEAEEIRIADIGDLGEALIRARVASGLTQAQLAQRVGLRTSAINRYEANGYRSANLTRLAEIAAGLDFNLAATLQRQ